MSIINHKINFNNNSSSLNNQNNNSLSVNH